MPYGVQYEVTINEMDFCIARTTAQLQKVFQLVHKLYAARKLMKTNTIGMRYSIYELFSPGFTVISSILDRVTGTGSVHLDSPLGLPADTVFPDELDALRNKGNSIVEGSMLSCEGYLNLKAHHISAEIFGICMYGTTILNVDKALLVVHPRHVRYYKRVYGWEPISDTKVCGHVKGKPGVLIQLDLKEKPYNRIPRALIDKLGDTTTKEHANFYKTYTLDANAATEFLTQQPSIVEKLSEKRSDYIASRYPGILDAINK